jgi:hypothetical protein
MTEHANIYVALCAAQATMGKIVKGAVNPAFKSKYADLSDVVSVVVPAFSAQGIAMHHSMMRDEHGMIMRTTISHGASDTHLNCDVPLIVDRQNMQGMKSATTYAKRIGVESLAGIAADDDDGNAAASAPPPARKPEPQVTPDAIDNACDYMARAETLDDLAANWRNLPSHIKAAPAVVSAKDARKAELTKPADDLGGDSIPY